MALAHEKYIMKANYMLWVKSLNLPPIALQADRDEVDTSKKEDFLSVKLRYVPTDFTSAKYKKNVC